ncbi:MAG TPA: alkaline phosphatase family protein [Candidatus Elarobacter sp.]|nr:alkaline phosphatase family protein [Candidatus Elarobacter sp.]
MMLNRLAVPVLSLCALLLAAAGPADEGVPRYDHIVVIVEENKGYATVLDRGYAPNIARLAHDYGSATQMFAEVHPSEANYVALLGGDTFGIHDDDAWFCVPQVIKEFCKGADGPDYVAHLIMGPNLASQLRARGLTWRAYLEDIPAAGSLAIVSPETATAPAALYAAKHTGFTNFASVHADPDLTSELVGFDRLDADLRASAFPAFALVVPNQCNEMHGIDSPKAPAGCGKTDAELVRRGDDVLGRLVESIRQAPFWDDPRSNAAIVVTWDEDGKADRVPGAPQACCVIDAHNPGGGHIPTIVITNHGPRGIADATPYDHYSLLRTVEDALRLDGHLRHAGDAAVHPMTPLFEVR